MKDSNLRSIVISSLMAACGLILPVAFHMAGLGNRFLPMLLPILMNGFLSRPLWAILTGAFVPPAGALLTGMPPLYPPIALLMSIEGAILGGTAAFLYRLGKGRIWPALITAVVLDRIVFTALMWFLSGKFGLPGNFVAAAAFLQGLPGTALQLAVAPLVLKSLKKRKGILFHYDQESETPIFR